jgi:hypothetical protein
MCRAVSRNWCILSFGAMIRRASRLAIGISFIFVALSGFDAAAWGEDLATKCFNEENPDAAVSSCEAAITSGKFAATDLAKAHVSRGNAYFSKGNYDEAIKESGSILLMLARNFHEPAQRW